MEILTFLIIGMFIGMLAAFGIVGVVVHFMDKEYLRQTIYKDFTDESDDETGKDFINGKRVYKN